MKLVSIQYVRALAALAVVLFHATRSHHAFLVGAAGVDIFFVISGFIMWTVTERSTTPGTFIAHRLLRVAPLYWGATLIAAILVQPDLARFAAAVLFVPWRAPDGGIWPVLIQGWTLQYEMFFYVLFAAGLALPRRAQLASITIALVGLSSISLAGPSHSPVLHTYTDPILLEFLSGIWLAILWRAGGLPLKAGPPLLAAAAVSFVAAAIAGTDPHGWERLVVWGVPAWMLVAGCLALEERMPVFRLGLALGDGSYSTYLFHSFITSVVWRLPLGAAIVPVAVVASAAGGWLIFRFVEGPMTRLLRGKSPATTAAALRPAHALEEHDASPGDPSRA